MIFKQKQKINELYNKEKFQRYVLGDTQYPRELGSFRAMIDILENFILPAIPMSDEKSSPRRTDSEWGEDDLNSFLIGIEEGEYL